MTRALRILLGLAALAVTGLALLIAWALIGNPFRPERVRDVVNVADPPAATAETLALSGLTWVGEGPLLRAVLDSEQTYDRGSLGYDKTSFGNARNLAFLAPGAPPRWLFPTNAQLILEQRVISTGMPAVEQALVLTVVEADGNGDGRLSARDPASLMIVAPDGTGLARLADGLSEAPELTWREGAAAALLTRGTALELLRFDPATRQAAAPEPVALP